MNIADHDLVSYIHLRGRMGLKKIQGNLFSKNAFILIIVVLSAVFSYWGIQSHDFINFDDDVYVKTNDYIRSGITLDNIKWAFMFNGESYWHPVTWLSLMLDCHIFGLKAGPLLVENVVIHVINALLLFFILLKLTGARFKAGAVAILFAVHPLNVESVAWLVERKTVLSTFFLLSAMLFYIYYVARKKISLYLFSFLFFTLGLMAKPVIMIFPVILIIIDYWPLNRFRDAGVPDNADSGGRHKWIGRLLSFAKSNIKIGMVEKIPFFIMSAASVVVSMLSLHKYEMVINYGHVPVDLRLSNFFVSIFQYLRNFAWPVELSIYYPFPQSIPIWFTLPAVVLVLALCFLFIRAGKKRPWLLFGWCWFIAALLPASGLLQSGLWPAIANRFMYIPIIGILVMLIWELDERISGKYAGFLKIVLCAFLVVYFSSLTRVQNLYYTNSYSLFNRSLEVVHDNALALNNIAVHLIDLGRHEEAAVYLKRGIDNYPQKPSYYQNYGICLVAKGDDGNAVRSFEKAIKLDPRLFGAYINLGLIRSRQGNDDEALNLMEKAMEINPRNLSARNNYGTMLAKKSKFDEAIPHFVYVVTKDPDNVQARLNLAQAYEAQRKFDEAMQEYEWLDQRIKKNKGYVYYAMAGLYIQQNQYEQGQAYLEKAQKNEFHILQLMNVDKRFVKFRKTSFYKALTEELQASGSE